MSVYVVFSQNADTMKYRYFGQLRNASLPHGAVDWSMMEEAGRLHYYKGRNNADSVL